LAENGAMFTQFYVAPVCSPTRAEFLSGRYHTRSGVVGTSEGGERMHLQEATIAEMFREAGYATAAFGKWHNGMQYPYHPNGRGFDEFYGFCSGHWGDYFSPPLEHNGQIVRGNGYLTDDLTDKAIEFIEQHKNRPFFVYIPYNTPHSPMQVPDEWWVKFQGKPLELRGTIPENEDIEFTRAALAMCENIDWNVGRVMQTLNALGLDENTIVIYFNDNGPNGHRWNDGMKGVKGSTDEGGVRTPFFIQWPGVIPAGKKVDEIAGAIDLLPTLAGLAGVDLKPPKKLDGVSLKPLLFDENVEWEDRIIFSHWNGRISARNQQYRYSHQGELFDMIADPGQTSDISREKPDMTSWLKRQVEEWSTDVFFDNMDARDWSFPVGHPDYKYTQLPARDGRAHGGIVRSNRSPNSTYFTDWAKTSDRITWDVEVLADGDFKVDIYYTCPPGDARSTIQLVFGESILTTKISDPHDPPLRGMENDRILRTQSYVKDFRPMDAGTIHLKKGRGELTLQAIDIPGSQVMDFRLMMLTRIGG
jgi:arylsulfatase A-like enzyme